MYTINTNIKYHLHNCGFFSVPSTCVWVLPVPLRDHRVWAQAWTALDPSQVFYPHRKRLQHHNWQTAGRPALTSNLISRVNMYNIAPNVFEKLESCHIDRSVVCYGQSFERELSIMSQYIIIGKVVCMFWLRLECLQVIFFCYGYQRR